MTTETTKKPRKSTKSTFVIQQKDTLGDGPGWADLQTKDAMLDSTAACKKYISDTKLAGTFRVIAVKAQFTTEPVQTTRIVFK